MRRTRISSSIWPSFALLRNELLVYTGTLIGHIMRQQIAMTTSTPGVFRDAVPLHKQMAEAIARNHREAERAARDNVIWTQNALDRHNREHQTAVAGA